MKLYDMQLAVMDNGVPYPSLEEAQKAAKEWAEGIADSENCQCIVLEVKESE